MRKTKKWQKIEQFYVNNPYKNNKNVLFFSENHLFSSDYVL